VNAPFDPSDPFDVACEEMRKAFADLVIAAHAGNGMFTRLDAREQVGAVLCGGLTGVVGVLMSMTTEASRADLMEAIADYLPTARENAESVTLEGLH
jgi:hypothetical protein